MPVNAGTWMLKQLIRLTNTRGHLKSICCQIYFAPRNFNLNGKIIYKENGRP